MLQVPRDEVVDSIYGRYRHMQRIRLRFPRERSAQEQRLRDAINILWYIEDQEGCNYTEPLSRVRRVPLLCLVGYEG